MMPSPTRRCSRCGREDDYSALDEWIEEEDESWTCPNCFTTDDRALVAAHEEEAAAELMDASCSRCGRGLIGADDSDEWLVVDEAFVCPSCRTHLDVITDAMDTIEKLGMDGDDAG